MDKSDQDASRHSLTSLPVHPPQDVRILHDILERPISFSSFNYTLDILGIMDEYCTSNHIDLPYEVQQSASRKSRQAILPLLSSPFPNITLLGCPILRCHPMPGSCSIFGFVGKADLRAKRS